MNTKRKRLIDAAEISPPVGTPTPKKRKGRISIKEKEKIQEESKKAQDVFDVLKHHRNADNKGITEHFIRTPSRRADPDYYKSIKETIDLTRIKQKIKSEEYHTFEDFCKDVELLVSNSKTYYKEDSQEYKDAVDLLEVYKDARGRVEKGEPLTELLNGNVHDDTPSRSPSVMSVRSISDGIASRASTASIESVDSLMVEDIICGVLDLADPSGRIISPPFKVLQNKDEFAVYYEKIKNPIDLKKIAQKAREDQYQTMQDVEADFRLLCKNAQEFNGKDSEIYKDAAAIMKYFKEKSETVLEKGVHPKRREKVRRTINGLLQQAAPTVNDEMLSEDSEEDESQADDSDDPMWQLYWTIRNTVNDKDSKSISEPFSELPKRSYYPDYYDEITEPMSFFMINKKLKRNEYKAFTELVKDMLKIYENACEYNLDGSEIFMAACKLQELTLKKAQELKPDLDMTMFDKKPTIKVASPPVTKTPKATKVTIKAPIDSDSDGGKDTPPPKKRSPKKMRPISTGMSTDNIATPGKPGRKSMDELMLRYRQKLMHYWEVVYNYREGTYWPAGAFISLPSRREYPDYYEIIDDLMDMSTIKSKIENNMYETSKQLIEDMRLMFNNARKYNEQGSQLYRDATTLEDLILHTHETSRDEPVESPVYLKQKFGWLKTKLPEKKKKSQMSQGGGGMNGDGGSFPLSNGYHHGGSGFSDDESSNSSISFKTPAVTHTPKAVEKKTPKTDKKMEGMIARLPEEQQRMWRLFNGVREYTDEDGRRLSTAFLRLPTREEYPDYYEVIKKPMDLQRIQQRLNSQGYPGWGELVADMGLMLDNACKYNEPDSAIYKDAVSLQRVLLEKKRELGAADESMPRVQVEIRTMLTNIFVSVFSKKEPASGRCLSDSFSVLPELLKAKGIPSDDWPFSFEQIKRNIDKCRYRRLDRFQRDFFDLFEKAREVSKPCSNLFDDSRRLQLHFIEERDNQCKNIIVSNVYNVIAKDIIEMVETQKRSQLANMTEEERLEIKKIEEKRQECEVDLDSVTVKDVEYKVPCYVYIARTDDSPKGLPHLMRVERIFRNNNGDNMVRGNWVYRPCETLHLASRKFVENEVFLTPFIDNVAADRLIGKCLVISMKAFLNNDIDGFEKDHLYCCEWRYHGKPRYFVKIKNWPYPEDENRLNMSPRSRPISPVRVISEFVKVENDKDDDDKSQSHSSSSSEEDDRLKDALMLDIDRQEVRARGGNGEPDADGRVYLMQMLTKSGRHYALGEFVLVFNPQKPLCDVMRIDKLWRDQDGSEWFSGGWFARPSDITHDAGRMFYLKEVFAVNQPDQTRRVDDIQTRCSVLLPKEYVKQRPTEIPECDVFVCESRVVGQPLGKNEMSSLFIKPAEIKNGEDDGIDCLQSDVPMHIDYARTFRRLRFYKRSDLIADEELFLFKAPITMEKEMSPLMKNEVSVPLDPLDMDMLEENDTDGAESVASNSKPDLQSWLAVQPKLTAKSKSGYILFSAEIRKRIMHENPEAGFGEVSKIVGIEWKKLNDDQKRQYEVRAEYIASERAKQEAVRSEQQRTLQPGQMSIYQCKWIACDSQFDGENALYEHIVQHHTSQIIMDSENQYVCMWSTCLRNRKDGKPFPSLPRLHRHMRDKHLMSALRNVLPQQLGKNFYKLITSTNAQGEQTGSLVHCPYGKMAGNGGPTQNNVQQTPHVNGHHPPQTNGGDHHYAQTVPHPTPNHAASHAAYQATPSSSHYQSQAQAQMQQQQQQPITDAGRTIVRMHQGAEPVFVAAPNSVHAKRVLHSETYLKYIESLSSNRQRSVSKFERSLGAGMKNTQTNPQRPLPAHWVKDARPRPAVREEEVTRALWKLRDQLLESTCNLTTEREFNGML